MTSIVLKPVLKNMRDGPLHSKNGGTAIASANRKIFLFFKSAECVHLTVKKLLIHKRTKWPSKQSTNMGFQQKDDFIARSK